jgi:hypothetical protein
MQWIEAIINISALAGFIGGANLKVVVPVDDAGSLLYPATVASVVPVLSSRYR